MSKRGVNVSTRVYVTLVAVLGAACFANGLTDLLRWIPDHPGSFVLIVVGTLLAEWIVINFAFGTQSWSFSITEVAITFGILLIPSGPLVVACMIGLAGAQILLKRPPIKAVFNVAMYGVATTGAGIVYQLLSPELGPGPQPGRYAALGGMLAFYIINQILLGGVVALAQNEKFGKVLRLGAPMLATVWLGNVILGMLAHFLFATDPTSLWLISVPVLLAYLAYRGWIQSKAESVKMHALYRTGSTLITGLETAEGGLEDFLSATKDLFRAEGAELLTFDGPSTIQVLREDGSKELVEFSALGLLDTDMSSAVAAYLESRPWSSHLVARLATGVTAAGALIVHSHHGPGGATQFPTQDSALLQLLADESSIAIRNSALFESISEERQKLSDIVEHTSDGIYQVSPERRIVTWNPAMENLTGFSAAEALGQMCFNILRSRNGQGIDMCSRDCPIMGAAEHHCAQQREAQIMTKDGAAKWIHYTHSPILDIDGEMTSDVIVVRDITQQRAAQEAKDDFISSVSHELRTPLTPIKGFLQTLIRRGANIDDEQRMEAYTIMLRQSRRLERLVEDLLQVSKIEAGQLAVEPESVDVDAIVEQALADYRHMHPERQFDLIAPDATFVAYADPGRLEQILTNLLQNAVRYTPEAEPIEVSIEHSTSASGSPEVVIGVHDRGPGISHTDQALIFDRFYRAGNHLTRPQGGTGLGLFIARGLAEAMGGRITLRSRLGEGAKFFIHVPAAVSPSSSREPSPTRQEGHPSNH